MFVAMQDSYTDMTIHQEVFQLCNIAILGQPDCNMHNYNVWQAEA
jgi:hypothetical protein